MAHDHGDGSFASAIVGFLSTVFFGKIFGLLSIADVSVAVVLGASGAIGGYFAKKLLDHIVLKFKNKSKTKK